MFCLNCNILHCDWISFHVSSNKAKFSDSQRVFRSASLSEGLRSLVESMTIQSVKTLTCPLKYQQSFCHWMARPHRIGETWAQRTNHCDCFLIVEKIEQCWKKLDIMRPTGSGAYAASLLALMEQVEPSVKYLNCIYVTHFRHQKRKNKNWNLFKITTRVPLKFERETTTPAGNLLGRNCHGASDLVPVQLRNRSSPSL